jgi:hypothetical protein
MRDGPRQVCTHLAFCMALVPTGIPRKYCSLITAIKQVTHFFFGFPVHIEVMFTLYYSLYYSTRRKPATVPLCSPQIPHRLNWARTWAAAVGSRRLNACAMALPLCIELSFRRKGLKHGHVTVIGSNV